MTGSLHWAHLALGVYARIASPFAVRTVKRRNLSADSSAEAMAKAEALAKVERRAPIIRFMRGGGGVHINPVRPKR